MDDIRCLSIRQPWAWLVAAGIKDIENRNWPVVNCPVEILIHAGVKRPSEYELLEIESEFKVKIPRDRLLYGGVVGQCTLAACVESHRSEWFKGEYGFVIEDATELPFRPCRGQLGFFRETPGGRTAQTFLL